MGKKGGAKKGKAVVMSQQEFFQSQQAPADDRPSESSWGAVDLFG